MRWYIGLLLIFSLMVPQVMQAAPERGRDRNGELRIREQTRSTSFRTDDTTKRFDLRVVVTGGSRPYTYAWYEGSVGDTSNQIGNRDRARITITHGTYTYWAEIRDNNGDIVQSRAITVSMVPRTTGPLAIRKQPRNKEVESTGATTSVELEVSAIGGTRPYTYTWYEGLTGDTTTMVDEGAEIVVELAPGEYSFWAEVSDNNGDSVNSNTATITVVTYPLTITYQSLDESFVAYDSTAEVDLEIDVDGGVEPYTYTWYQGELGDTSTIIGSDDEIELELSPDTYTFWAEVNDDAGERVISDPIVIDVVAAPLEFKREPRNTTATWRNGSARTTLSAEARGGTAPLTYEWFLEGTSVGTGMSLPVVFTDVSEAPRNYAVVVTDAVGESITSRTATVRISLPPFNIISYTQSTTARWLNGSAIATVSVRISGGVGPFTYTWYAGTRSNPGSVVATGTLVNGSATARFDTGATAAGRKTFFVTVTDGAGTVKYAGSHTTITVLRPPAIPTATPTQTPSPTLEPTLEPTTTP